MICFRSILSAELLSDCKDLARGIDSLEKTRKWSKEYRNAGFASPIANAKEIAEDLEAEPVFKNHRVRRKKVSNHERNDELRENAKEHFRILCSNQIMDNRFEQLRKHYSRFGFLNLFNDMTIEDVRKSALDLEVEQSGDDNRDIDSFKLSEQIKC